MSKRIYRLAPCPNYDLERTESWLQDMAKEGWFLTQDGFIFNVAVFESGTTSHTMRYRLEAAPKERSLWDSNNGEPDDEARELSETLGWKYICSRGQFYIYASSDPSAPELNTDPEVQALTIKLLKKRQRNNIFNFAFWLAFYSLLSLGRYFFSALAVLDWWMLLSIALFLPVEAIINIKSVRYLRNLQKRLENGQEPNHNTDWRKGKLTHRLLSGAYVILLTSLICSVFSTWSADILKEDRIKLQDYTDPIPFATMADFVEGEFSYHNMGDHTNFITARSTFFAPVLLEMHETGEISTADGQIYSGGLYVIYMECRYDWMAEIIAKELVAHGKKDYHRDDFRYLELPELDVDYSCGFSGIFPTVVIADGSKVISARYYQTGDEQIPLEVWTSTVADSLN